MKRAGLFLDRDGTVCEERGYVNDPSRLALAPGAARAIRRARELGFAAVLATNQAGAARGYFPYHALEANNARLRELLAAEGTQLDALHFCPHHPSVGPPGLRRACECRKPRPGMLVRAADELDLDLALSFMVGDSFKDVAAGRAAGVAGTVLLRTGYGRGELRMNASSSDVWPDHVADDLPAAISWIEEQLGEDA